MVQEIITYPTPPSVEYATDVRIFDQKLYQLIDDLKETITENNLEALAAYQIGSYFTVVVAKNDDGTFLELINPRLFNHSGKVITEEKTAYFGELTAKVERYENISVVYQDREGEQKYLKVSGAFAILLQRKIDYTFGSTFLNKLSKDEKKRFEKKLEFGSNIAIPESCPVVSYKDYIVKFVNLLLIAIVALLLYSFFQSEKETLKSVWNYQVYLSLATFISSVVYLIYGFYEGKRYSACTSCQVGNLIGTMLIISIKLTFLMVLSYFIVG